MCIASIYPIHIWPEHNNSNVCGGVLELYTPLCSITVIRGHNVCLCLHLYSLVHACFSCCLWPSISLSNLCCFLDIVLTRFSHRNKSKVERSITMPIYYRTSSTVNQVICTAIRNSWQNIRILLFLLDEATYEISKTWAFWFQSRRFLKVFPMLVYVKHVGPWAGPFLVQGLQFEKSW